MQTVKEFIEKKVSFYPEAKGRLEYIDGEIAFNWGCEYANQQLSSKAEDSVSAEYALTAKDDQSKTANEILDEELSDNMLDYLKDNQTFRGWIVDAMLRYAQQQQTNSIEKKYTFEDIWNAKQPLKNTANSVKGGMTAEDYFEQKFGNKLKASDSWVIRFAEEYAQQSKVSGVTDQEIEKAYKSFLKGVDEYVYGQETHQLPRTDNELSKIKTAVYWCKFHAQKAFESLKLTSPEKLGEVKEDISCPECKKTNCEARCKDCGNEFSV